MKFKNKRKTIFSAICAIPALSLFATAASCKQNEVEKEIEVTIKHKEVETEVGEDSAIFVLDFNKEVTQEELTITIQDQDKPLSCIKLIGFTVHDLQCDVQIQWISQVKTSDSCGFSLLITSTNGWEKKIVGCKFISRQDEKIYSLSINKENYYVDPTSNCSILATVKPKNTPITWSISDTSLATIDANGKVTVKQNYGETIIIATIYDDKGNPITDTCRLHICDFKINITHEKTTINEDETTQWSATATPAECDFPIQWKSESEIGAKVDENGLITGKWEGNTRITAFIVNDSGREVSETETITVNRSIGSIKISNERHNIDFSNTVPPFVATDSRGRPIECNWAIEPAEMGTFAPIGPESQAESQLTLDTSYILANPFKHHSAVVTATCKTDPTLTNSIEVEIGSFTDFEDDPKEIFTLPRGIARLVTNNSLSKKLLIPSRYWYSDNENGDDGEWVEITKIAANGLNKTEVAQEVYIPKTITSIDFTKGAVFASDLDGIFVEEENTKYYSSGKCLIKKSDDKILAVGSDSIIPTDSKFDSLSESSFNNLKLKKTFTIPSNIKTIKKGAFNGAGAVNIQDGIIFQSESSECRWSFVEDDYSCLWLTHSNEWSYRQKNLKMLVDHCDLDFTSAKNEFICETRTDQDETVAVIRQNDQYTQDDWSFVLPNFIYAWINEQTGYSKIRIREIVEDGFKDNQKISSITFDNVAQTKTYAPLSIGQNAFVGCTNLKKIEFKKTNYFDWSYYLYDKCFSNLNFDEIIFGQDTDYRCFADSFENSTCKKAYIYSIYLLGRTDSFGCLLDNINEIYLKENTELETGSYIYGHYEKVRTEDGFDIYVKK